MSRRGRAWPSLGVALCIALGSSLAACAQQQKAAAVASSAPGAGADHVAYVRMEELVRVHPLYSQLARLDEDMQALELKSVGPQIARSGAGIGNAERALQKELDVAAEQTKKALTGKQQAYAARERAAINAALGASAGAAGPGGSQIAGGIAAEGQLQAQAATQAAQQNFDTYRKQLIAQNDAAVRSLQRSLSERATRSFRAEVDRLQRKEADFALQKAADDAAERLSLRTRLSNLALDDASRADVKKQLDALDRSEADALAAMKNRDQTSLVALQKQLHAQAAGDLRDQVAALRSRTLAKINDRALQTRKTLVGAIGLPPTGSAAGSTAAMAPDMRAKLLALHQKYQNDFNKDASQTIAEFQKTRADLSRRFAELSGVDANAQAGARKQMDSLQKQRGDLYDQIVAQIGREVKVIAQQRGINVVVSGTVAPAAGVDLTPDAKKDIESLHE